MFIITPVAISSFVSVIVFLIVTTVAWQRKSGAAGYYFAMMVTSQTFWTVMVTLGYAATTIPLKIFFATLDAWGYTVANAFLLLFALSFTGHEHIARTKRVTATLFFYTITNILLVTTNQWHGLYWSNFTPEANNILLFEHGPAFAYTVLTSYAVVLSVLVISTIGAFNGSNIMKRQARWVIVAILTIIALNVAYHTNIAHMPGVDWSAATSSLFGLITLWALYGDKLLDISPVARNKLIDSLSDGMIALDLKDRIIDINRSAARVLGNTEDALLGKNLGDVFPRFGTELKDSPEKEVKFEFGTNDQRFYDVLISPLREEWPKGLVGRLIILRDVTERKQTELRLLQLHKAVEQSPVSVVITDIKGNIEYVNPFFSQLTGYELAEVIGQNPRIIQSGKTSPQTYETMWHTIRSGKIWRGELLNKKKNGEQYWEVEMISPVINSEGAIVNYIAIKEDVTAQKESNSRLREAYDRLEEQMKEIQGLQDELREQAIRDPLTGLHNRHYLNEVLGRELSRALREGYTVSFMLMDIDHFKSVNDTYGHAAGDIVLKDVANQLTEFTRAEDIVCRYGGEEFLMVLPNTNEQDAFVLAERLRSSIQETRTNVNDKDISITISVGISEFPKHGRHEAQVIEAADKALYHAKHSGRNQVALCPQ